jgi:anti-anti-sigma factor
MESEPFRMLDIDLLVAVVLALVLTLIHVAVVRRRRTAPLPPALSVRVKQEAGHVTVAIHGELDLATAPALEHELVELLKLVPDSLMLDLRDLAFIDSTGMHALIEVHDVAGRLGVELELCALSPPTNRVVDAMGVRELLKIAA